jgi:hypothetical protein
MSVKLPKIQNTDDFQSYIDKVNAVIEALNKGDLYELLGDRELIYFDTSLKMIANEKLSVGDICMTLGTTELGDDSAKIYRIVASTMEFDTDLYTYYKLDNGLWAYNFMSFSGGGGTGTGGVGGDISETITAEATNPSKFATALGDEVYIHCTYNTTVGTSGTLKVYVDDMMKMTSNVTCGEFDVEIGGLLITPGTHLVEFVFTNKLNATVVLSFVIEVVSLSMTSNFDDTTAYTGNILFSYMPTGAIEKAIHFVIDGEEKYVDIINASGRQQSRTIEALTHGSHTMEVFATATVGETELKSNTLSYTLITYEEGNDDPIIASHFSESKIIQGAIISIDYIVHTPGSDTSQVTLLKDTTTVNSLTVGKARQYWNISESEIGEHKFTIKTGEVTKDFNIEIIESEIKVEAEKEGLTLYLTSSGRSNAEDSKEDWISGATACTLTDFNYNTNGWVTTDRRETVLRVTGDARVMIPYPLFSVDLNPKTNGSTIEFEFETRNVANYDAILISCMNNNIGLQITAQKAILSSQKLSGESAVETQFKEEEKIRVAFVIESQKENRLIKLYINGVMSGLAQYDADDIFVQGTPAYITIGSNEAGIDIYNIRRYNHALTTDQILKNYIADMTNITDKMEYYTKNNIYDAYNNIVYNEVAKRMPCLTITGPLPTYKGDDKTVNCVYRHNTDATKDFEFDGVSIDVQGTSSQFYPRKNYKLKFPQVYKLREDSIPVKAFTFKADYMDSSHRHNTVEAELTNDMYKAVGLLPPQEDNKNVRMSIDGYICAIFHRETENDERTCLGAFNFNIDKGSNDAFGYNSDYPNCESWEFCNNTSGRCLFKEFWSPYYKLSDGNYVLVSLYDETIHTLADETQYYKLQTKPTEPDEYITVEEYNTFPTDYLIDVASDFEARYPKKYEDNPDYTALRRLVEWVASTENDINKFKAEIDQYMSVPHVLAYYVIATSLGMVDSMAKNMFLSTWDGTIWYPVFYDMDTCFGLNNEGEPKFNYDIEFKDNNVFNGASSTLWTNILAAYPSEINAMYETLVVAGFTYDEIERRHREHIMNISEAIFNEEAEFRYVDPLVENGNGTYLYIAQGTRMDYFRWWTSNRFNYLNSKYFTSDYKTDFMTLRMYTPKDDDGNVLSNLVVKPDYDFTVTTYASEYVNITFGSITNGARVAKGIPVTITAPANTIFNDTETIIYGASNISSLGDLSGKYPSTVDISKATRLNELIIGNSTAGYQNTYLKSLSFGNNRLLTNVDVRNCTELTGTMNMVNCENIEHIYATNTKVTSVALPAGGNLKTLQLPSTITNLTVQNQKSLENFSMTGSFWSDLTTLRIENTPNIKVANIVANADNLTFVRLLNVDMSYDNFSVLEKLATLQGLDENGNPISTPIVTGRYYSKASSTALLEEMREKYATIFPELEIDAMHPSFFNVSFVNYDGTILDVQSIEYGLSAIDPITREESPIDPPTRPADHACSSYTFSGWNGNLTNITSNQTIAAVYTPVKKRFTVNFYNGDKLISSYETEYGGKINFYDETFAYPGTEEGNWQFWKWNNDTNYVTGDCDTHAIWVNVDTTNGYTLSNGTVVPYQTPISELDWWQIKEIADAGLAPFWWEIGDEKDIKLSDGQTVTVMIADFDHDHKDELRRETLPISFHMKNLMSSPKRMNSIDTNAGGYTDSTLRAYLNENVYSLFPLDLKNNITPTCKYSSIGAMSYKLDYVIDKLWIPSIAEVNYNNSYTLADPYLYEGRPYPIYTTNVSRIKYMSSGAGSANYWWLRSPSVYYINTFWFVANSGICGSINADSNIGIAFGFCI